MNFFLLFGVLDDDWVTVGLYVGIVKKEDKESIDR